MKILKIEDLQDFIEKNPLVSNVDPLAYKTEQQRQASFYFDLLENLSHHPYCAAAITELKSILKNNFTLDQKAVADWIYNHYPYFDEHLVLFGVDYLENESATDGNLDLRDGTCLEKDPFLPIIQFWNCMWLLYYSEYNKAFEERTEPDPNDYYYVAPDPNRLSDIDTIKSYLEL